MNTSGRSLQGKSHGFFEPLLFFSFLFFFSLLSSRRGQVSAEEERQAFFASRQQEEKSRLEDDTRDRAQEAAARIEAQKQMQQMSRDLKFEEAAKTRDKVLELKAHLI